MIIQSARNFRATPSHPMHRLRMKTLAVLLGAGPLMVLAAAPAGAVTGGQPDEGRHPYVGGTVLTLPPQNQTFVNCTGSLISPTVFLTAAAHCGRDGTRRSVSFDEVFDPATSPRLAGTFIAHPDFDPKQDTKYDVAVIELDEPVPGVDPSRLPRLPTAGLLDRMKGDRTLNQSTRFTSVGYGFLGYTNGPGGQEPIRGQARRFSVGSFNSLSKTQLHLSQNPARDDGGTCNGDSGAPNFLGSGQDETLVIAGLASTGDTYCNATNVAYRLDTANSRQFLGRYVSLP